MVGVCRIPRRVLNYQSIHKRLKISLFNLLDVSIGNRPHGALTLGRESRGTTNASASAENDRPNRWAGEDHVLRPDLSIFAREIVIRVGEISLQNSPKTPVGKLTRSSFFSLEIKVDKTYRVLLLNGNFGFHCKIGVIYPACFGLAISYKAEAALILGA
jgi:hypothetical protein